MDGVGIVDGLMVGCILELSFFPNLIASELELGIVGLACYQDDLLIAMDFRVRACRTIIVLLLMWLFRKN